MPWSRSAAQPHGHDASSNTWSPQPKVGLLEPGKSAMPKVGTSEPIKIEVVTCAEPALVQDIEPETKDDTTTFVSANTQAAPQADTDSDLSDIGEDVVILLGGHDETSAWQYKKEDGEWSRVERSLEPQLRLSDIRALPRDSAGVVMSFGSLGHMLKNEPCKVCVFNRKNSCRQGWLCNFCHATHQPYVRARRPQRRRDGRSGSGVGSYSDSQSMASSTMTGTNTESELSTRESAFSAVSHQAEPRYVHVAGDSMFAPSFAQMATYKSPGPSSSSSTTFGAGSKPKAPAAKLPFHEIVEQFHSPRSHMS